MSNQAPTVNQMRGNGVTAGDRLRRVLRAHVEYSLTSRTHLSLHKDAPISRPIAAPADGHIVAIPHLGGLHPMASVAKTARPTASRVERRRQAGQKARTKSIKGSGAGR